MSNTAHFKVFCLERFKSKHRMTGREAHQLFKKFGVLEYLGTHYDVLHTYGEQHIVQDIDLFIEARNGV
jgi:hypothetical protein